MSVFEHTAERKSMLEVRGRIAAPLTAVQWREEGGSWVERLL